MPWGTSAEGRRDAAAGLGDGAAASLCDDAAAGLNDDTAAGLGENGREGAGPPTVIPIITSLSESEEAGVKTWSLSNGTVLSM